MTGKNKYHLASALAIVRPVLREWPIDRTEGGRSLGLAPALQGPSRRRRGPCDRTRISGRKPPGRRCPIWSRFATTPAFGRWSSRPEVARHRGRYAIRLVEETLSASRTRPRSLADSLTACGATKSGAAGALRAPATTWHTDGLHPGWNESHQPFKWSSSKSTTKTMAKCSTSDAKRPRSANGASGFGHEAVKDPVGVGVEPGDLARVGDPRDLGHLHAVVERLAGVIQEGVHARYGCCR